MKEETFIENLSEQMTLDIIEDLRDNAVAMDSDIFLQDLAVLVETLKAMLKRDFGHKHPMHDITDNLTKIITTPDGRKFTDINYAKTLGYKIKLLSISELIDNKLMERVHPCLVLKNSYILKFNINDLSSYSLFLITNFG